MIRELTAEQISRTYRCRVTNAFVHSTVNSTGSYTLTDLGKLRGGSVVSLPTKLCISPYLTPCAGGNFPADNLIIYKELETEVTTLVGGSVEVSFVSATLAAGFVYDYRLDGSVAGISTQRPYGELQNAMLPAGGGFTSTIQLTVLSSLGSVIHAATLFVYGK